MKKRVLILLCLILISFVSASIDIGNKSHLIDSSYNKEDALKGWVNLSIENEDSTLLFTDSLDNSISLIDLFLESLSSDKYSCNPQDCDSAYETENADNSKTFEMNFGESKIIGFKFQGNLNGIDYVNLDIYSDADKSCSNQLELDFFSNNEIEFANNKSNGNVTCNTLKRYGCFDDSESTTEYFVAEEPNMHCQEIEISASPGFKLGAWIDKKEDSGEITFALFEKQGDYLGEEIARCEIPEEESGQKEYSCYVDALLNKEEKNYLCVFSENQGTSKIRGYGPTSEGCASIYDGSYISNQFAYDFFVIGKQFGEIGQLKIRDLFGSEQSLAVELWEYLGEKTNNEYNCTKYSCVVPLKINSYSEQEITIENISIRYGITSGGETIMEEVYELEEVPALISTKSFQKIELEKGNFTLPKQYGNYDYSLNLGAKELFSEEIIIEKVPEILSLSPSTTITLLPTEFEVLVNELDNASIESYTWEFENLSSETTSTNKITKTFTSIGNYELKVNVIDEKGKSSSKIFNINVGSPQLILAELLNTSKTNLENIENQLENYDDFEKTQIKNILNFESQKKLVNDLELDFETASNQDDYNSVMSRYLDLSIPESIEIGVNTGDIDFYLNADKINSEIVNDFQGGTYDSDLREQYANSIVQWNLENIDSQIKYKQIIGNFENSKQVILEFIEFNLEKVNAVNYSFYVYLTELDNLAFKEEYGQTIKSSVYQIPFDESEKTIKISTSEKISIGDLEFFISPSLENLVLIKPEEPNNMKWALFILLMIFLILIGIGVYIFLQYWYQTKYEKYLFKDRTYLYNLIHYISNSKNKGVEERKIIANLKKTGWKSEQINYVMKKFLGKKTGMMFEIPIDKLLDKFRKKKITRPESIKKLPVKRL